MTRFILVCPSGIRTVNLWIRKQQPCILLLSYLVIPRSHPSASNNFNHYSVSCRHVYINSIICEKVEVSERFNKTIVSAWKIAVSVMVDHHEAFAVTTDLLKRFICLALPGFEPSTLGSVSKTIKYQNVIGSAKNK